jgi:PKD repeat protein
MLPASSGDSGTGSRPHRTLTLAIFHLAIVSACLAVLSASRLAWSAEAHVQWNAIADPSVVLYELHWGVSSGQYQWTADALSSSTDISGLQEGETYYFAVKACPEERSLCSAFSAEVAESVPYAQPEAGFEVSPAAGVVPLTVSFTDTSSGQIEAHAWDFGDGASSAQANPTHTYTVPGTYTVSLIVTGSGGSATATKTDVVSVSSPAPVADFEVSPAAGVVPLTVSFTDTSNGQIEAHAWDFGDGASSAQANPTHTYTVPGTYTVSLIVTGSGGSATAINTNAVSVTDAGSVSPPAPVPEAGDIPIEVGELTLDDQWLHVDFEQSFSDPIVIVGPLSGNGSDPAVVGVRDVTGEGFDVRVQEWNYLNGTHGEETVSYLAIERGTYQLPNGAWIEADRLAIDSDDGFFPMAFAAPFVDAPVVITAITTYTETDAVTTRVRAIDPYAFEVKLQEEEASNGDHDLESIDYVAWEPSTGELEGLRFEAGRSADAVTDEGHTIAYASAFDDPPLFLADMQTTDGGDTANLRRDSVTNVSVDVWVDEEQSKDAETNHTSEVVGYLLMAPEPRSEP